MKRKGKPKKLRKPTPRQSAFAKAFMKSHNLAEAAIKAGYSKKNPTESGYQALKVMAPKVSEMMDEQGLSVRVLIQKYLSPLLEAKTTKFAQEDGEFTDAVDVEDNGTRKDALDMSFRLHGAYAPTNAATGAEGVKIIVLDMPRPRFPHGDLGPGETPKFPEPDPNGSSGNGNK
jgi:hypothetical protein